MIQGGRKIARNLSARQKLAWIPSALGKNDPGVLSKFDPAQEAAV